MTASLNGATIDAEASRVRAGKTGDRISLVMSAKYMGTNAVIVD